MEMEIFAPIPPQTPQNISSTESTAAASSAKDSSFRQELDSAIASDQKNPEKNNAQSAIEQKPNTSYAKNDDTSDAGNENSVSPIQATEESEQKLEDSAAIKNNDEVLSQEGITPSKQQISTVISTEVQLMIFSPDTSETVFSEPMTITSATVPGQNITTTSQTGERQPLSTLPQTTEQTNAQTATPALILSTLPAQWESLKEFHTTIHNIILNSNETQIPTITLSSSSADSSINQNTLATSTIPIPETLVSSQTTANSGQAGGQYFSVTATITERQILQPLTSPPQGESGKNSVRQSMTHQLVNAQLTQNAQTENSDNQVEISSNKQNSNEFNSQQATTNTTLLQSAVTNGESTGIFSLPASTATPAGTSQIITQSPVMPAAHYTVSEHEIMQQIYDKFHVNTNLPESRINMQLHPVELGELKIDISIREGNIKANVIAQSQMAQDVIEKNVGKLKTVLNEQGLTVEEITITARQQPKNDFNFQEQQFLGQEEQSSHNKNNQNSEESFNISKLTDDIGVTTTSDGVHLTA